MMVVGTLEADRLSDLTDLASALREVGLPTTDLDQPGRVFFGFHDASGLVGYGGLEGTGPDVLLRSVVVAPDRRNDRHGERIVAALEGEAAARGAVRLHLLTTTAAGFFGRQGYASADRHDAPACVTAGEQFRSLCPATATYLVKRVAP